MTLNFRETFKNETKIIKLWRKTYPKHVKKTCIRHLWQVFFRINPPLFKTVSLIEVNPKSRQEKQKKSFFIYDFLAIGVNERNTKTDLKICQCLRLHMKIIFRRFHIIAFFQIRAHNICEMSVHKHTIFTLHA